MNYDQQQNNDNSFEPWDQGVYRTGSTKPPKNRGGIIAVLLVAIILLCGVISVLGIMNIRLFQQLNKTNQQESLPIMFSNTVQKNESFPQEEDPEVASATEAANDATIGSESSPISIENTPDKNGLSLQAIYENIIPSVVSISCQYQNGSSTGTGVILSEEGYIVTNCHVVKDALSISVLLTDGRTVDASLVGIDAVSDLAVLHIVADGLVPAQLGDSSVLRVGDTVVAIGDPLGIELRGTMTDGIVSAINRDIDVDGRTMSLIQTNAALNSGNSGGPLINCYGQVIGINTMKMGDSMSNAGVEGLGFAIPSTTVKDIVNQLIEQGYVSGRPELGISGDPISEFYQFYYRLPRGLYITEVKAGSSAEAVGLEIDDILMSIDGTTVTDNDDLESILYAYEPGDTIQAIIYRNGKQYQVSITLGEATN